MGHLRTALWLVGSARGVVTGGLHYIRLYPIFILTVFPIIYLRMHTYMHTHKIPINRDLMNEFGGINPNFRSKLSVFKKATMLSEMYMKEKLFSERLSSLQLSLASTWIWAHVIVSMPFYLLPKILLFLNYDIILYFIFVLLAEKLKTRTPKWETANKE